MNKDGKQGMTHARMKITQGQHFQTDALQIVANWLCECCGFEHPYPGVFEARPCADLYLQGGNASAVGDPIQSQPPAATGSGDIGAEGPSMYGGSSSIEHSWPAAIEAEQGQPRTCGSVSYTHLTLPTSDLV